MVSERFSHGRGSQNAFISPETSGNVNQERQKKIPGFLQIIPTYNLKVNSSMNNDTLWTDCSNN